MGGQSAVGGLARSVMFVDHDANATDDKKQVAVVTVSRDVGASGGTISGLLAKRLFVPCYGYSMIDNIIKDSKTAKHQIDIHDEKNHGKMEDFVRSILTDGSSPKYEYYSRLIQAVRLIADTGGVILGRGAHLILACHPQVFRVRIEGSLDYCVKRIALREHVVPEKAKEIIAARTKERGLFLKALYKRFPNNLRFSDLVVNTDKASDGNVVDIIICAMEKMGHYVPSLTMQKLAVV